MRSTKTAEGLFSTCHVQRHSFRVRQMPACRWFGFANLIPENRVVGNLVVEKDPTFGGGALNLTGMVFSVACTCHVDNSM